MFIFKSWIHDLIVADKQDDDVMKNQEMMSLAHAKLSIFTLHFPKNFLS